MGIIWETFFGSTGVVVALLGPPYLSFQIQELPISSIPWAAAMR